MQNSTIETHAKRNHQSDLPVSATLIDSNKLKPPKSIQKPTTDSATHTDSTTHDADLATHADSTHLWNPITDSTSILELKPSQHPKDHHDTKPMADLPWSKPTAGFFYTSHFSCWLISISLSLYLITLLVVLRCWSSCKIWFKILSCCEIVDIVID